MTNPIVQSDKPILAYSRFDGQPVALTPSASQPGVYHYVTMTTCSCKGFSYRSRCRHLSPAPRRPAGSILVARLSA